MESGGVETLKKLTMYVANKASLEINNSHNRKVKTNSQQKLNMKFTQDKVNGSKLFLSN